MIVLMLVLTWLTLTDTTMVCLAFMTVPNDELIALHYEVHEWHGDRYEWPPSASRWHVLIENIPHILFYFMQLNRHLNLIVVIRIIWIIAPSTRRWCESPTNLNWSWPKSLSHESCWSSRASKLIIQTWPWCWSQTCWYSRASRWSEQWASLTAAWFLFVVLTFSTPEQNLNTWDREWFLKRLSFGRCWPNTEAWTNFVRTSEGLRCVPTFSYDLMPSLRTSWIHKRLRSICFDFLEMPRREAIVFLADEPVLSVILISLERIADFSSLMKCLIASDSTAAWVITYNSASALEWYWNLSTACRWDIDWEQRDQGSTGWSTWSLTSSPIWIWIAHNFYWNRTLRICCWNLRIHDVDEVSSLIDTLEKMNEVLEIWCLGIRQWLWQLSDRQLDVIPELWHTRECLPIAVLNLECMLFVTFDLIFFRDRLRLDSVCGRSSCNFEKVQ